MRWGRVLKGEGNGKDADPDAGLSFYDFDAQVRIWCGWCGKKARLLYHGMLRCIVWRVDVSVHGDEEV